MRRRWLAWLYGLICLVLPVAVLVLVLRIDDTRLQPATVAPTSSALMQPLVTTIEDTRNIPLILDWGDPPAAPAPAMDGLVSEVLVAPGESVTSGTPIITVGGITRVATSTFLPTLVTPKSPPELTDLVARFLVEAGLLTDPAADWGDDEFHDALHAYQAEYGLDKTEVFDPSWQVWLPNSPFLVESVTASTGRPPPPVGEPLLVGPAPLLRAQVDPSAGEVLADPAGMYRVLLGGEVIGTWDLVLPLTGDVTDELQRRLDPQDTNVALVAELADEAEVMSVPVSAVVTGPEGRICLVDTSGAPIWVEMVGSSPGAIDLVPITGIGPIQIEPDDLSTCAS